MIQATFRAEGLPLDLAYIPLIESAFKPSALSRAKARGVWQFMRGTALENGLRADWYLDERADPTKATQAAAKYLKTLHGMFEDWHLAMASYNGGPGRVKRALTRSRKNDFWTLSATTQVPAARDPRLRADDSRGGDHRQEPGAVRLRHRADGADRRPRPSIVPPAARSAPRRRMGRRADGRHPGAQPGVPPLDDAGQEGRVHDQGAGGHGRSGPRRTCRQRRPAS